MSIYSKDLIQKTQPKAMYDKEIHNFFLEIFLENPSSNETLTVDFINAFHNWFNNQKLNNLSGINLFDHKDVIIGVTNYIDDIYATHQNVIVLEKEYKYHARLNPNITHYSLDTIPANSNLIISMPFSHLADVHPNMNNILDKCLSINTNVHIDSAWIGCSKNIVFDYAHPAIKSIGVSLSKGFGLGVNRIGLRYSKERWNGPVSIVNDFHMNNFSLMHIGIKFLERFEDGYFWNKYEKHYNKVCNDFDLRPSKAIHIAFDGLEPVGVRPLLRSLEETS